MFFPRASAAPTPDSGKEFEQIVERYHGKVFQLVYRYTGDYEEACDLTQDTFVRAFNAWGEFRGDSQVYTWLYRIALNLCHNQQKRIVRRQRMERWSLDATSDDDFDGRGPIEVADERPLPLTRLEGDEMRTRLREALLELPENYRVVIVLRDIEGLTYEEIAKVTDSTLEAIKSRLFRARQTLRRILEPYMTGGLESEVAAPRTEAGKAEKTPVWRGAAQPEAA
jgi:RNA polymerase sigma-70 factor (ECF subfamily)